MVVLSPRKTVDAFVRLHDLPPDAFGPGRTLLLNGINVTARELEQAVGRHAGNRKVGKVSWQHDPAIQKICDGWPQGIDSARARALGFETDKDLDEVVRNFIADDLDDADEDRDGGLAGARHSVARHVRTAGSRAGLMRSA